MSQQKYPIEILIADDDEDDRFMAAEALKEARLSNKVSFVEDGEELMDYLRAEGKYTRRNGQPYPGIILLDLNMPKKSGREALQEIKADPKLDKIPVVILTTSKADNDIIRSYDLGVDSFITKPVTFDGLIDVMRNISLYCLNIVRRPD